MTNLTDTTVKELLGNWVNPKAIKHCVVQGTTVLLDIEVGYPITADAKSHLIQNIQKKLLELSGIVRVEVNLTWKVAAHAVQAGLHAIEGVKNIIAVASGKGGVGKSTTAVNLALALASDGARVGMLDADIYGPNQPQMLGVQQKLEFQNNKKIMPIMSYGIQSMSMGYLIDSNTPMIWRGPMVSKALQQLLRDTIWDTVDYLFIDLPPGTGDIQLTLVQKVPISGAIIVTTPQDVALLDARRGLEMFKKVSVPVLGIVENMSTHICTACGHEEAIFGLGGGMRLSKQCDVPLLGQLPLDMTIRQDADSGNPTVAMRPQSDVAQRYHKTARRLAEKLSLQDVNYAAKFPKIVVELSTATTLIKEKNHVD